MPEKIVLEDGTEREVPTEEELNNLKAGHDANLAKRETVKEFNTIKEELGLQEGESLKDKLEELKQDANPNFKALREKVKRLTKAAKESGAEVDDEGNPIEKQQSLTPEQVAELSNKTFDQRQIEANKVAALSKFSPEDAKSIGAIFDKIHPLGGSFEENMNLAIAKILPDEAPNTFNNVITAPGGGAPRIKTDQKGEVSNELKTFANDKLGLTEEDFNLLNK